MTPAAHPRVELVSTASLPTGFGNRWDCRPEQTDAASFAALEPVADGFRDQKARYAVPAEALPIDRAQLLTVTARKLGRAGEIRPGLRGRVDEDESRSLRSRRLTAPRERPGPILALMKEHP